MDVSCPACHSKNTQKITTPTVGGPTHSKGSVTDSDVSASPDDLGDASTSGTTGSRHDIEVFHTSPEPKLKTDGNPVLGTVFLTIIVGWIPALTVYVRTGKLLSALLVLAATICLAYVLIKMNIKKNRHYKANVYPQERDEWENGFYCHDCENVFVPAGQNKQHVQL